MEREMALIAVSERSLTIEKREGGEKKEWRETEESEKRREREEREGEKK